MVDNTIRKFMDTKILNSRQNDDSAKTSVPLFYKAQMHQDYKKDEQAIKKIIYNNVRVADPSSHDLKLHVYYNSSRTHNLVLKNNPNNSGKLQKTNVVYMFTCPYKHDHPVTYIGHTRTTLSRRLAMHTGRKPLCSSYYSSPSKT